MNTIALAVPVLVGIEVTAAIALAWLCWRLARRRNLQPLRDLARAFIALGVAALAQLVNLSQMSGVNAAFSTSDSRLQSGCTSVSWSSAPPRSPRTTS